MKRILLLVLTTAAFSVGLIGCGSPPIQQHTHQPISTKVQALYPLTTSLWGGTNIDVCWEATGSETEKGWVQAQVTQAFAATPLRFNGWGNCPALSSTFEGIRVQIDDVGPHTKGLGQSLSNLANGMVLNFTFNNWGQICKSSESLRKSCIESIAVHEFGHAIGLAHEQNRTDTPDTCTDPAQGTNGNITIGEWDIESVMNYCNPIYNNNGNLSERDTFGINVLYGRNLIRAHNQNAVYLVENGVKRHVTSTNVICGFDWNQVQVIANAQLVDELATGTPITTTCGQFQNGDLIRGDGDQSVFRVENGVKRHVTNTNVICGFDWNQVQVVSLALVQGMPTGSAITTVCGSYQDGALVRGKGTLGVFRIENGVKRHVLDSATFDQCGFDWNQVQVVSLALVQGMPTGGVISSCE